MAFDALATGLAVAGTGALGYLAAGREVNGKPTLRLSLDKNHSLITDVRVLGGILSLVGAWMLKNQSAKKVLGYTAAASFASVATTEAIRYKWRGEGSPVAQGLPLIPKYGALPGPQRQPDYQGAWGS